MLLARGWSRKIARGVRKRKAKIKADHYVVLPACTWVVPEQKSFNSRHLPAGHMTSILPCALRAKTL